jgi:hypothetical protein
VNNKLLFAAGLGVIVFLVLIFFRNFLTLFIAQDDDSDGDSGIKAVRNIFFIIVINSVAFAFYLRYVGFIPVTFHLMSKVVFMSLVPPVIMYVYDKYRTLIIQKVKLEKEKKELAQELQQHINKEDEETIVFVTENKMENLELRLSSIIFLRSADNYVEIVYLEGEFQKKSLIRNTLKNIEIQLRTYTQFQRCHRTCLVNSRYINKLIKRENNYLISLKFTEEILPVSRQYLLKIKELA